MGWKSCILESLVPVDFIVKVKDRCVLFNINVIIHGLRY